MSQRFASISLDLDNLWSYLKTHGDPGWTARPSYLDTLVPLMLDRLAEHQVAITVFVVGVDAARTEHHEVLSQIAARGHEIGNHSHEHEPWLDQYSPDQLATELDQAADAIEGATGQQPVGFRGPGFSWSPALLDALAQRGYQYDASTLPTFIGPLARAYYFRTARLTPQQREERRALFGHWRDGLRPIRPYYWALGEHRLLEIPVTTMPGSRTPFHLSYLLWLYQIHPGLMRTYLATALTACRLTGTEPSFLLHPLDLIGGDRCTDLKFFPGMELPTDRKLAVLDHVLQALGRHYELGPMGDHARRLAARGGLGTRTPASLAPASARSAAA